MAEITRQDLIDDDALKAPGILTDEFQKLLDKLDDVVKKLQEYSTAFSSANTSTAQLKESTAGLTDEQKVLGQIQQQIAVLTAKQSEEYVQQVGVVNELKQSLKEKTQLGDRDAESINRQNSSIKQLGDALNANRAAYANLRSEADRNSEAGKKLLGTIQEQDKAFKELQNSIGKNQEKVGDYKGELEGLLGKFGEAGKIGGEAFKAIGEAAESGWALVTAGIGLAGFALKQFFGLTQEGRTEMEIFELQVETNWDQFRNKIATATGELIKFFKADKEYYDYKEKQRVATMNPEQLAAYNKQKELEAEIRDIVIAREDVEKEEIGRLVNRTDELDKAAKLELVARVARADGQKDFKTRLDAIVTASEIYDTVQERDIELASKKAGLANTQIYLQAQGRELNLEEQRHVEENINAVHILQEEYDRGQKRRKKLEDTLHAELMKQIEDEKAARDKENDTSLYQKDVDAVQDLLAKQNAEKEKLRQQDLKDADAVEAQWDKDLAAADKKALDDEYNRFTKYMSDKAEAKKEYDRKEIELEKQKIALEGELARSSVEATKSILTSQLTNEEQAIQSSLNSLQEKYNADVAAAGDNAAAKKAIDAQYAEDQKRLNDELAQVKRKAAIFDKAAAILDVGIKTAQAVAASQLQASILASNPATAALAAEALAQIPIELGIGAAQIAAIAAKPLPQYFKGTQNHPGGLAVVGEMGSEFYVTPSGMGGLTPSRSAIMNLPQGTQVFTNEVTRMLALQGLGIPERLDKPKQLDSQIVRELRQTNSLLSRKSQSTLIADGVALITVEKTQAAMVQRIRSNVMIG